MYYVYELYNRDTFKPFFVSVGTGIDMLKSTNIDKVENYKSKCNWRFDVLKKFDCKVEAELHKNEVIKNLMNSGNKLLNWSGEVMDIKLIKGMSKEEVNYNICECVLLYDDIYLGRNYKHTWKCIKCGKKFQRRWYNMEKCSAFDCGCVEYDKQEKRYKYEVEKDGNYEYIRSFRKGDTLPNGKIIKSSPWIQIKHKYCGSVYEIQSSAFINTKIRCSQCCQKYENSFAHYIEVELGENLEKYWDFDKNTVNPYHIYKYSNIKVWIKRQNEEVNELNKNYHESYFVSCSNFKARITRRYNTNKKISDYGSIYYNDIRIAKMIVSDENGNKVDTKNISRNSNKRFYFKCNRCGKISSKSKQLNNITKRGYSCEYCSDGISIPEKFMSNVLKQLEIDYIHQKSFDWSYVILQGAKRNKIYDFYIPSLNMIIETHGIHHYEESNKKNIKSKFKRLEYEQENDRIKKELALDNGIEHYIEVDCRYSELKWLKENIIKELSPYVDLSNINWNLAWEESQNSLCVKAWELWNEGISISVVSKTLNLNRSTVIRYLESGEKCGIIKYTKKKMDFSKKTVICLTTKKIFTTMYRGAKYYDIDIRYISLCCKGKRKSSSKLSDGTKLVWKYLIVDHNRKYRSNEMYKLHSKQIENIAA